MSDDRIRVSRRLHIKALCDAIDWESSFLNGHEPEFPGGPSCCTPENRCEAFRNSAELLRQYRRELDRVRGPQPPEPPARTVTLHELAQRYREQNSG